MAQRSISTLNEAAVLAGHVIPIVFARLNFLSGVLRLHTQIGDITFTHPVFGIETYNGIGDIGGISAIEEGVATRPFGVKLVLTGVKQSLISQVLTDEYHRREANILIGLRNTTTGALVDDPFELWSGFMDKHDISVGKNFGRIIMSCESRADMMQDSDGKIFNDEDQQALHAGDVGFEYLDQISLLGSVPWGDKSVAPPLGGARERVPGFPRGGPNVRIP